MTSNNEYNSFCMAFASLGDTGAFLLERDIRDGMAETGGAVLEEGAADPASLGSCGGSLPSGFSSFGGIGAGG